MRIWLARNRRRLANPFPRAARGSSSQEAAGPVGSKPAGAFVMIFETRMSGFKCQADVPSPALGCPGIAVSEHAAPRLASLNCDQECPP